MTSVSPDEAGLDEGHVPVDLGAVPEGFDVGSVDGQSVDQSADPDSVTGCRKTKTLSGCLSVCSLSLSLSTCLSAALSTFRTGSLTGFAALDSVVVHLERSGAAGANTRSTCHHIVIYIQTTREHNLVSFYQKIRKNLKYLFNYLF